MSRRSALIGIGDPVRCTATGQLATVRQIRRWAGGLVYTLAPVTGGQPVSAPATEWEPGGQPYARAGEQSPR